MSLIEKETTQHKIPRLDLMHLNQVQGAPVIPGNRKMITKNLLGAHDEKITDLNTVVSILMIIEIDYVTGHKSNVF